MDKLIRYDEEGRIYCCRGYEVALARLASYEATGLSPDEVTKMGMMFEDSKRYSGRLEGRLKAYGDLGTIARLRELAQADREGRCVVLPATTVFELTWDAGPECDMICPVSIDGEGQCDFCDHGQMFVYERKCTQELAEQIGKNVFLTREEAEAALKEKER